MSQSRPSRSWVFSLAILDAVVTGLSSATSMGYAWDSETENPYLSAGIALGFGVVMSVSRYFLNGRAMIKELTEEEITPQLKTEEEKQPDKTGSSNHYIAIPPATKSITSPVAKNQANSEIKQMSKEPKQPDTKKEDVMTDDKSSELIDNSNSSILAQSAYTSLSSMATGSNRYFILHTTFKLFTDTVNPLAFWPTLVLTTLLIERPFTLTNEDAETNSAIAESFSKTSTPYYARFFSPCSSWKIRNLLRILGSVDHMTTEMLSISGYLTKKMIDDLKKPENELIRNLVIGIGGAVGIYCAVWIFIQTYYFEGRYTENFLLTIYKKLLNAISSQEKVGIVSEALIGKEEESDTRLSPNCFSCFKYNIAIIGPAKHGESAASPVFNVGRNIAEKFPNHYTEIMVTTIGATAITGIVTALVTYFAEIKHTLDEFAPREKQKVFSHV